jgi:hypothetical protein
MSSEQKQSQFIRFLLYGGGEWETGKEIRESAKVALVPIGEFQQEFVHHRRGNCDFNLANDETNYFER